MTSLKKTLLVFSLLIALPACATTFTLSSEPIEGVVREEGTNKPVPEAIVVVRWQGHLGYSGTICYHVETTKSDAEGRYRIPAWSKPSPYGNITDRTWLSWVYKPGYQYARVQRIKGVSYIQPFTGTREDRFKYLFRLDQSIASCRSPEAEEENLVTFYRALYEEMKALAESREEADFADGYLKRAETLELGREEAERRARARAEQRNRQPLKSDPSALEGIIMRPPR